MIGEAYLARPEEPGPHPGVLFVMDAIGLRPQIRTMIERIASWGYVVLAPNVFHRSGTIAELAPRGDLREDGVRETFMAGIGRRIGALTPDRIAADLPDYIAALRGQDDVGAGPLGVTGYCMGARLAVRAACLHPEEFAAVGGFHGGRLADDAEDSPHRGLPAARAAFVFGHADQDPSMPPAQVETLGRALADAGLEFSNAIYPGAPHGYTMNDTSAYQEEGAERHYRELRDLFDRTLR